MSTTIHDVFDSLCIMLNQQRPDNNFTYGFAALLNYQSKPLFADGYHIYVLTPMKYLEFKAAFKGRMVPILVVHDSGDRPGYYSPVFIANRNATFSEISRKTASDLNLYLVDSLSTSGFLMPLFQLWTSGIIEKPSLKAAQDAFNSVHVTGSTHDQVKERVIDDVNGLGAVWDLKPNHKKLKVLLRYGLIPQDVVAISNNLSEYQELITNYLQSKWVNDKLSGQPLDIDSLIVFTDEFRNAYSNLEGMRNEISYYQGESYQYLLYHFLIILSVCTLTSLIMKGSTQSAHPKIFIRVIIFIGKRLFETVIGMAVIYLGIVKFLEGADFEDFNKFTIATSIVLGVLVNRIDLLNLILRLRKAIFNADNDL